MLLLAPLARPGIAEEPPQAVQAIEENASDPAATDEGSAAPAATSAPVKPLPGGGYKEAKWGMSKQAVQALFDGLYNESGHLPDDISNEDGDIILKYWKDPSPIFYFVDDQLYKVVFQPLGDGDEEAVNTLLKKLATKYGVFSKKRFEGKGFNAGPGEFPLPTYVYSWEDRFTQIQASIVDANYVKKHITSGVYPSSTFKIVYRSKPLLKVKDVLQKQIKEIELNARKSHKRNRERELKDKL
jgi:hypothetical protein